jgi:hypothetical protein
MSEEMNVNVVTEEVVTPVVEKERLLKIAVIGTGNCGSMLANDACEALGIDGIAINGSERDLKLVSCPRVIPFKTGDGKGTGKDRDTAKKFFLEDSGLTLDNKFIGVIENNDIIIVATSTGGGYGSGSSTELMELLTQMYPSKVIIAAGVLPFNDEQYAAFEGSKSWLKELMNLGIGYMLYDNNQFTDRMSPNKAAKMVNECFIEDLRVLQGDYINKTFTGGIDERDMLTVLSVPGRIVADSILDLEPSDVLDGSIVKTIKEHIKNETAHADLVSDKEILASAMMYTLGEEFDEFKSNIKSDLQTEFGVHVKDTTNFADDEDNKYVFHSVALILSGLSAPNMVIDKIVNKANELSDGINKRKASMSKLFKDDTEPKVKAVTAKQSFAEETVLNKANEVSKDSLLKEFLAKKNGN